MLRKTKNDDVSYLSCAGPMMKLLVLFSFGGLLLARSLAALAAVPVIDDLQCDDAVDECRHDVREDHHRVARLLDRCKDASSGATRQQENGDGRQLARTALPVVGHRLNQLQNAK